MSIYRISSNTIKDNSMFHLKTREYDMDKTNYQINTGKKHRLPREGAVDIAQSMTLHSKLNKIEQYFRNITYADNENSEVETRIMNSIPLIHRARELAVQGANGTYNADDRRAMAEEIDQILKELVVTANDAKYNGYYLFSGFQKSTQPFETLEGAVKGADRAMITQVKYLGDNGKQMREIADGEYISTAIPGSDVFWGENFQIYSQVNTANYRMTRDMSIQIDNIKIDFNAGDNIYAVMDKINMSKASVKASVDIVTGGFILKSTTPHKLQLEDIEGGTLLQDLGILEEGFPIGPDNYNYDATVFGGSIFDTLIGLRDSFLSNNMIDLGGRHLGALDYTITNLTEHVAQIGALDNRLTHLTDRYIDDKEIYTETLSKIEDVDIAESISELKMLEFSHKVALSSLARLSQTSLMDFLR